MKELNYLIVSKEMVWQWYYDSCNGKHFRELIGKDALLFIQILESGRDVYIEDILPKYIAVKN